MGILECIGRYIALAKVQIAESASRRRRAQPVHPSAEILATNNFDLRSVQRIQLSEIDGLADVPDAFPGSQNYAVKHGFMKGQHVFVKVSRSKESMNDLSNSEFTNEVAWMKELEKTEWGPKLFGTTVYEGRRAVVSEFVKGTLVKVFHPLSGPPIPKDFRATGAMIQSLERMAAWVEREKVYVYDLQVFLRSDGVKIVDSEYFSPAQNAQEVEDGVNSIRALVNILKSKLPSAN